MSSKGEKYFNIYNQTITSEIYNSFLRELPIPKDHIVLMDNARIHKTNLVNETIVKRKLNGFLHHRMALNTLLSNLYLVKLNNNFTRLDILTNNHWVILLETLLMLFYQNLLGIHLLMFLTTSLVVNKKIDLLKKGTPHLKKT